MSKLTPHYIRGDGKSGTARIENELTVGHRYLIFVANLYTANVSVNLNGQVPTTTGIDVEYASMFGNGAANSSQRPFGTIVQGKATATSFTLTTGSGAQESTYGRWSIIYFDLNE